MDQANVFVRVDQLDQKLELLSDGLDSNLNFLVYLSNLTGLTNLRLGIFIVMMLMLMMMMVNLFQRRTSLA